MLLIDNNVATTDWNKAVTHVQEVLQKGGAKVLSLEPWGERKLAYKIGIHKRGTYMLGYFEAPTDSITSIRKEFHLSDMVIRNLILQVRKKPEAQAEKQMPAPAAAAQA